MKHSIPALLAVLLAALLCGCGVADREWEVCLPTDSDELFAASPAAVTYPLPEGDPLTILMTDDSAGDFLASSTELTGVRIETAVIARDELSDRLEVMLDAGDVPDLIDRFDQAVSMLDRAGMGAVVIDLTPWLMTDAPNYLSVMSASELLRDSILTDDGETEAFLQLREGTDIVSYGPWIRADWLDALGLDIPRTYDEYETVLIAFRDAYGTSDALLLPVSGAVEGDYLSAGYGVPSYVSGRDYSALGFYIQDGTVKYAPLEDGFWDYAARLNDWYSLGLMSSDFVSYGSEYTRVAASGEAGIFYLTTTEAESVSAVLPEGALEPIPDAVLTAGDETHFSMDSASRIYQETFSVSEDCADPGLAVRWCDFWYSEEGQKRMNYGVEGLTWQQGEDGTVVFTDFLLSDPQEQRRYLCDRMPGILDLDAVRSLRDASLQAVSDVWMTHKDSAHRIPGDLALSDSDAERFGEMITAIQTYTAGLVDLLIVGEVTQSQKAEKIAELRSLGIDKCLACLQTYASAGAMD